MSIGEWFFSTLGGITPDPDGPGFRKILIRPQPVPGLTWANATYASPSGAISSAWKREGRQLAFEFGIPPNTTATVRLPAANVAAVRENGRPIAEAPGVRLLRIEGETIALQVHSGQYRFVVDAR